jgi:dihydrofolate synthase/folylpolyglutamate synthase
MSQSLHTLDEALDYLYSFINYEVDSSFAYGAVHYNVDRTRHLLDLLGNPERSMDFVHVAGTKGKGSVCTIIERLLRNKSGATGLFSSPHIERVNERIAVDGAPISDGEFIGLLNELRPLIDNFDSSNLPTTFEILTAMAVAYFKARGVRLGILETGMGGRFDSTNFCDPILSIITPISYDHMDKLGDRIEDIAGEKAGIIKPGRPVVLGYQVYDVSELFIERARGARAPLYRVEEHCSFEIEEATERGSLFHTSIDSTELRDLRLSLPGIHQVENAVTALFGLKIVGLLPGPDVLREGLSSVVLSTRLELIDGERRFLLDSAHNGHSARVLAAAVERVYRYRRLITILGIVKDKDTRGITEALAPLTDRFIITEPVTHKELDTDAVIGAVRSLQRDALLITDIGQAIRHAVSDSTPDDLILITGSFYTTSPARAIILGR